MVQIKLEGACHRNGLYNCAECREQFTVTVGTVFEGSKIKLHILLQAAHLLCSSEESASARQLERKLSLTYETV